MENEKTQALRSLCSSKGLRYVGFRGNPRAPLWFVGEGPGADEDQSGFSFTGPSGRELDKMLAEAGISANDCCFTNPYKIRPPDNKIERLEELGIAKQLFIEAFFEELNEYKPTFVIPLGGTALEILCPDTIDRRDKESKISKWRGSLLISPFINWPHYVLPNFHPAYILREWSDRDVAVFIFRKVLEEASFWKLNKKLQPLPERQLLAEPSFAEANEYLEECLAHESPISCDFELLARRVPIVLGLSYNRLSAVSIELFGFEIRQLASLWRKMDRILRTKVIIGQNWTTFDANWAEAIGLCSGMARVSDCLIRHHVLHPELSHKLDFQTLQYTREVYYKDEGRGWQLREGLKKLKLYNCKDAAVTLEIHEEQDKELEENPQLKRFCEDYEMPLGRAFNKIDKRGVLTDRFALQNLREEVIKEIDEKCVAISQLLQGRPVAASAADAVGIAKALGCEATAVLNLASVPQLKKLLKDDLHIKLKIDRHTHKESTGEETLNEAFAETGNPVLQYIGRTRELVKFRGTYIDTRRNKDILYSCSSVTGTVTGRRAQRKNFLGLGSNGQNQLKHSDLGERFQGTFISRPGHIFIYCDQASAEEWIVQGIIADVSGYSKGVEELKESTRTGVSRHAVLASRLFELPLEQVNDKECIEYYIGKKTRHAASYDMRENTMSAQMAAEGFVIDKNKCKLFLARFHELEPFIRQVYHKWIQEQLCKHRFLRTPLGRERIFHGLRPWGDNGKVFREAYAYIPQSTIGDNNGFAILHMETYRPSLVLQDGHDSMLCETFDNFGCVFDAVSLMRKAYERTLTFQNGFQIQVPIDFKIGYSMKGLIKLNDLSNSGISKKYNLCRTKWLLDTHRESNSERQISNAMGYK
jgi:DNA polymerase